MLIGRLGQLLWILLCQNMILCYARPSNCCWILPSSTDGHWNQSSNNMSVLLLRNFVQYIISESSSLVFPHIMDGWMDGSRWMDMDGAFLFLDWLIDWFGWHTWSIGVVDYNQYIPSRKVDYVFPMNGFAMLGATTVFPVVQDYSSMVQYSIVFPAIVELEIRIDSIRIIIPYGLRWWWLVRSNILTTCWLLIEWGCVRRIIRTSVIYLNIRNWWIARAKKKSSARS